MLGDHTSVFHLAGRDFFQIEDIIHETSRA